MDLIGPVYRFIARDEYSKANSSQKPDGRVDKQSKWSQANPTSAGNVECPVDKRMGAIAATIRPNWNHVGQARYDSSGPRAKIVSEVHVALTRILAI